MEKHFQKKASACSDVISKETKQGRNYVCTISLDALLKFHPLLSFLSNNFPPALFGSDHPHLNPTIVTMASASPNIEIIDPAMVKSSKALLSVRPILRALISCKAKLIHISSECWHLCKVATWISFPAKLNSNKYGASGKHSQGGELILLIGENSSVEFYLLIIMLTKTLQTDAVGGPFRIFYN